ncbi:MAG: bifunctional riboflavin kinase/FAD synthetase [Crocinitomicaceae bacterium]
MNIYTNITEIDKFENPVITIGTFDGVHLGHQKLLSFLCAKAQEVNGESVVFTFHPHPRMVLHPDDHNLELIQTIDERVEKLRECGIDHLIIFPFSKAFSRLSALEFVRDILVNKLSLNTLVVGYDHHFGRNREGSMSNLEELAPLFNFEICEIDALSKEEINISSTKIRKAIQEKKISTATRFLGSPFQLSGIVVEGDKIGASIGFPTANVQVDMNYKLIPPNGVYVVTVYCKKGIYSGMLNIGERPTVSNTGELRIEVHILDFEGNLYDSKIKMDLLKYIRPELNFTSKGDLINQIKEDEKVCRSVV